MRRSEREPRTGPFLRPVEISDLPSVMEIDEDEGGILGQIGVRHVLDELHVTTLAVRPERRRQGHARALVAAALAAFPEARRVHLEVRPSNAAARTLYEALGFATTGLRRRYYGDEDALLMTLDLKKSR